MAYTKKYMERWVEKYVKAHPHERITIVELAAYSEISARTWYRHKDVLQKINDINNTPTVVKLKNGGQLPTATQLVDSCKDRDTLIKMTQSLIDEIIRLQMAAGKTDRESTSLLKQEIRDKDEIIRQLKSQVSGQVMGALPDLSSQAIIESTSTGKFMDQFSSLFGDIGNE